MPDSVPVCQVEKSLLKTKVEGDVSGVKDIVRAMAIVRQMTHVAQLLRLLRQMQEEGLVSVLRFKERFLRTPSGSVLTGGGSFARPEYQFDNSRAACGH